MGVGDVMNLSAEEQRFCRDLSAVILEVGDDYAGAGSEGDPTTADMVAFEGGHLAYVNLVSGGKRLVGWYRIEEPRFS